MKKDIVITKTNSNRGENIVKCNYHGSCTPGIMLLEARSRLHNTEEKVVYLTDNIPYALFYLWDEEHNGWSVKHVTGWTKNDIAHYEEQFPDQLKTFYQGVSGYLYCISEAFFIIMEESRVVEIKQFDKFQYDVQLEKLELTELIRARDDN